MRRNSAALFVIGLLVVAFGAGPALAQCTTLAGSPMGASPNTYIYQMVTLMFNHDGFCQLTMSNNANCAPTTRNFAGTSGTPYTAGYNGFMATRTGTNPSCVWTCLGNMGNSCTITIDTTDGLPVELMEFSVGEDGGAR